MHVECPPLGLLVLRVREGGAPRPLVKQFVQSRTSAWAEGDNRLCILSLSAHVNSGNHTFWEAP